MSFRTVELEKNNPTYLDTYAWVLYKRGDYSQAKFYMGLAIEGSEEPSGVLFEHYGDILYRVGEKEKALEMWKKAWDNLEEKSEELRLKIETGTLPE